MSSTDRTDPPRRPNPSNRGRTPVALPKTKFKLDPDFDYRAGIAQINQNGLRPDSPFRPFSPENIEKRRRKNLEKKLEKERKEEERRKLKYEQNGNESNDTLIGSIGMKKKTLSSIFKLERSSTRSTCDSEATLVEK